MAKSVSKSQFDDLLTLLAISIFIDGNVANSELEVFKKTVSRIKLSKFDVPKLSETQAHAWFNQHFENTRTVMSGSKIDFDTKLSDLLDRIAIHAKPGALVHIIHMISLADGSLHQNETKLIDFVKQHWGVH